MLTPATGNLSILRTTNSSVELQPFGFRGTSIICRDVLSYHNHHNRRVTPVDLMPGVRNERVSMMHHVPELNLVIVAALNGRVAFLTLTKTRKRLSETLRIRRAFRVDWVLPRKSEEDKRLRPWAPLHGMAVSRIQDHDAEGLQLDGRDGGKLKPNQRYRLILHYLDHSILTYEFARKEDTEEDSLIF